ncbi:PadR family transcriptional regulator [Clostridium oryzae]|uniref:Transcriptional regulator PadR-like family protein n=1 Tax=Clostridium oryzae TaxID=1450648 RepID=A0A1V4IF88_9CLOT|nr:PadR family transcriptional regulator [Clostridium oryzae]OPJ58315.1 transcriptional regulator PadR-like family protein [Clostridium oryzae]
MSYIDLIILGYLQHGPKSAYEMVKEFETWNLHYWLKISNPAIYKNIVKLSDGGYLNSKIVKEGEMPEKTIYSLNEKGLVYFYQLMEYSSTHVGNIYFDFNAFISNIDNLPKEKRAEYLMNFKSTIAHKHQMMDTSYKKQHENPHKPDSAFLLLDLYKDLYSLLDKWSEKLKQHYDS